MQVTFFGRTSRVSTGAAPGYRGSGEGDLWSVGRNGYSCFSSSNDIYGLSLNFYTQNLSPSASDNRGHGFQLRCLSE